MFEIQQMVNPTRLVLFCSAWLAALIQVVFGPPSHAWVDIGAIGFAGFVILTLPRLRRDTVLILLVLVLVGGFLLDHRQRPTNGGLRADMCLFSALCYQLWRWCGQLHRPCHQCAGPSSHWQDCQHRRQPAGFNLQRISLVV